MRIIKVEDRIVFYVCDSCRYPRRLPISETLATAPSQPSSSRAAFHCSPVVSRSSGTDTGTPTRERRRGASLDRCNCLEFCGGPPGDRTRDTLIKSQVLYH